MREIIPTNTCPSTLTELAQRSERFAVFASQVHLDVSDGEFTPVVSWPFQAGQWTELEALAADKLPFHVSLVYEAHLMVSDPLRIGAALANAGAKRIIAHIEAFKNPADITHAVAAWKAAGADEVGLAITIDTPLEKLTPYAPLLDCILVMTIAEIGTQGNPFDARGIERLETLREKFPDLILQADGGITEENAADVARAGAQRLCVGSALSNAENPAAVYKRLSEMVNAI